MRSTPPPRWYWGPALALVHFGSIWLSYAIRVIADLPPIIWLSSGVAVAAFVLLGARMWPWVFLSDFCFYLIRDFTRADHPLAVCLLLACGATFGPWLGARLFIQRTSPQPALNCVREVVAFCVAVLGIGLVLGVSLQMAAVWLGGFRPLYSTAFAWKAWWMDGSVGALVVGGGAIFLLNDRQRNEARPPRWEWQWGALLLVAATLGLFNYTPLAAHNSSVLFRPYLFFPLIMWAAFRRDIRGALSMILLVVAFATIGNLTRFVPGRPVISIEDRVLGHGFQILVLSITGLVMAAAVRERSDALEARNEFLAIASHELKTPLTSLALAVESFRRKLAKNSRPVSDASLVEPETVFLDRLTRQSRRLGHIVDQLLDISRLERRDFPLQRASVDLEHLVRAVLDQAAPSLTEAGCELRASLAPGIIGYWDHGRIEQVIENLVSNAMKYAGGKPIVVTTTVHQGLAHVTVRDFGPGIAPEMQGVLFERFTRVDARPQIPGLGLGLYIGRQIVRAHDGDIRVENAPGGGVEFRVELPLHAGA